MLKIFLFGSVFFFLIELTFIHSEMYRSQVLKNTDILGSTPSTPAKDNVTAFPSQSYPYLQPLPWSEQSLWFLLHGLVLPVIEPHINRMLQYIFFGVWPSPLICFWDSSLLWHVFVICSMLLSILLLINIWIDSSLGLLEEKGVTEDEIVWWHHRLNGHEFVQTLWDSEG